MFTQALVFALVSTAAHACTGTISSLTDVAAAVLCTTININSFTVPAGQTFTLALLAGTTVNILGNITFGEKSWAGPLFSISGFNITFNGNGHTFNGNGQFYWDGKGSSSGAITKPRPMIKSNLKILNSPAQVFSVDNAAPLTISAITIDNSLGDQPNSMSAGQPAGANTDGFDVGNQAPLTITGCTVMNQDDCIAINSGAGVSFLNNHCSGGHGISIVKLPGTHSISLANGLRIKTVATATSGSVSGITYSGNTVSGVTNFGLLIDQSYPATLGTPGNGIILSAINFVGTNTFTIASGAVPVAVNCGSGSCQGTWNWAGLKVTGGAANKINYAGITGFSLSG
ncbi:polygalacturonase [Mycena metata]|uniref:endo-polygalacturonase n=1 Tax=Mycena metata TaxID=1033252 RepID=A0AAD7H486_9AGAR|nr:polygalacturonase [Mycena metata]